MYFFYRAFGLFIRTHTVYTAHEDIAKDGSVGNTHQHFGIQMESGVCFNTAKI